MADKETKETMAILGLIFAIIFPPIGLVLSIIAMNMNKKGDAKRGLAKAGLIVSIILIALPLLGLIIGAIAYFGVLNTTSMIPPVPA